MEAKFDWEEFYKGVKYFGKDRMSFFVQEPEALELLRQAPDEIRRKVYLKCRKVGVAWPEEIPVDMSAVSDQEDLFDDDDRPDGKNPEKPVEPVRFVCNRFPAYSLTVGKQLVKFERGKLITADPAVIAAVRASKRFNVCIFEG